MSTSVKGPGSKSTSRSSARGPNVQAAAERAFVRLKKSKKGGAAAEALGEHLDEVVAEEPEESEMEEAQRLMDAVPPDPPGANDMEKAQAIADALGEEIEATRDRRRDLAARIEKGFDDLG